MCRVVQIIIVVIACLISAIARAPAPGNGVTAEKQRAFTTSALVKSYFTDELTGWVISSKQVFRTTDGGKKWRTFSPRLSPAEKLAFVSFQGNIGILAVQKRALKIDDESNYCRVLRSTDMGRTWKEQLIVPDGIITNLLYTDDNNVWLVGYRKKGHLVIGHKFLVMHSSDAGKIWTDLSNVVDANVQDSAAYPNRELSPRSVLDALVSPRKEIVFFLNNLDLMTYSAAAGESWQTIKIKGLGKSYASFCSAGFMDNGSLWYARSAGPTHGMFGEIGIWDGPGVAWNGSAQSVFEDVLYLKDREFVAVGRKVTNTLGTKTGEIFYTPDGGKTWQTVYHDSTISTFTSASRVSDKSIAVVGEKGSLVKITMPGTK